MRLVTTTGLAWLHGRGSWHSNFPRAHRTPAWPTVRLGLPPRTEAAAIADLITSPPPHPQARATNNTSSPSRYLCTGQYAASRTVFSKFTRLHLHGEIYSLQWALHASRVRTWKEYRSEGKSRAELETTSVTVCYRTECEGPHNLNWGDA